MKTILFLATVLCAPMSWAQQYYEGRLLDGSSPVTSNIKVKVSLLASKSPDYSNCVAYEEEHNPVTPASDGRFSVKIGGGTPSVGSSYQDVFVPGLKASPSCLSGQQVNSLTTFKVKVEIAPDGSNYSATPIVIDIERAPLANVASVAMSAKGLEINSDLDVNSKKIINLDDPVSDQDAATKNYVDSAVTAVTGGGVVNSVTAGSGLVNTGTSQAPILDVDSGTGANKIVKLDALGKLPSVDGSQLANLNPAQIAGLGDAAVKNVGTAPGTVAAGDDSRFLPAPGVAGKFLKDTGSVWAKYFIVSSDIQSSVAGSFLTGSGCTAGQALVYSSVTDTISCSNIAMAPAGTSGNIQLNSSGVLGYDSDFNWDSANKRLGIGTSSPSYKLDVQGSSSNVFAASISNTNSNGYGLELRVGGTNPSVSALDIYSNTLSTPQSVFKVQANGNVGIGVANPSVSLDVSGALKLGSGAVCNSNSTNALQMNNGALEKCNGSAWVAIAQEPLPAVNDTGSSGTSTLNFDFASSPVQMINWTGSSCSGVSLNHLKNGETYKLLIVKSGTSTTCSNWTATDESNTPLTPILGSTVANPMASSSKNLFEIHRINNYVFVRRITD